ncbi:MAG: hypothetical protein AAF985_24335 [Bacteroidota bacterium]
MKQSFSSIALPCQAEQTMSKPFEPGASMWTPSSRGSLLKHKLPLAGSLDV